MRFKVLGCYGAELPNFRPTGFLIGESLLLDAGTIGMALDEEQEMLVSDVLITHSHMDHVKSLPFLIDVVASRKNSPIIIYSTYEVLDIIHKHLFNNLLWPDFTRIPSSEYPFVKLVSLEEGVYKKINEFMVKAIKVNHSVPAVGYIIKNSDGDSLLYTGDTGPTEAIWREASLENSLKGVIVETSFPNSMKDLALASGHLTPEMLGFELKKMENIDIPIFITHLKPSHLDILKEELIALGIKNIIFLEDGKEYEV
ncbi:MAG: 3',5'-cyclic-nucleotide phosphodiesterase [Nitrospirota bacterium]